MAITSELIGRLGGTDVQSSDLSAAGENRKTTHISTVTVPSGETLLVAIAGEFANSVDSHVDTGIRIGGAQLGKPAPHHTYVSAAKIITSTEDITMNNGSYEANPFTGTLYIIPIN